MSLTNPEVIAEMRARFEAEAVARNFNITRSRHDPSNYASDVVSWMYVMFLRGGTHALALVDEAKAAKEAATKTE